MCARTGGVLAPMMYLLRSISPQAPMLLCGLCPLLGSALTLLLPETAHKPLPDTIEDIEGTNLRSDTSTFIHCFERVSSPKVQSKNPLVAWAMLQMCVCFFIEMIITLNGRLRQPIVCCCRVLQKKIKYWVKTMKMFFHEADDLPKEMFLWLWIFISAVFWNKPKSQRVISGDYLHRKIPRWGRENMFLFICHFGELIL